MGLTTILLILLALLILWGFGIFNRLIRMRNQVKNSWSQIDVQLQRRYDLIPNLVETVKGYMGYEKGTLEAVVNARNLAAGALAQLKKVGGPTESSIKDLVTAETTLRSAVGNIFALAENYPELRASETMKRLQEELTSTENKIAYARQAYNDQVLSYNTSQQQFPGLLFATLFGHKPSEMYEIQDQEAKKAVKVSF